MKILQLKHTPVYDIFTGYGWLNWTRVVKKGTHLQYISGKHLPRIRIVEAYKTIQELTHK